MDPSQDGIPTVVFLQAFIDGGTFPYLIRWDLRESGVVTTDEEFVEATLIRPLQTISAAVTDSGTPARTGSCIVDVDFIPPTLQVGCSATPASGIAPLAVQFTADPDGCVGPCTFAWDFGDGSPRVTAKNPSHTYVGAGGYNAQVVLTDAVTGGSLYPQRADVCSREITVSGTPTPSGSPSPPAEGNHAPSISSIVASPPVCKGPQAFSTIQCQVVDTDGDDVTVTPSASPAGGSFTPTVTTVPGGSGTATFTFIVNATPQTYSITCTPVDELGLAGPPASTTVSFNTCGGGS